MEVAVAAVILLLLLQVTGALRWRERTVEREARARIETIRTSSGGESWEGCFYRGDGLGVNITLALSREHGAALIWTNCTGTHAAALGRVRESGDRLLFDAVESFGPSTALPHDLRIVRWGGRTYLVPESERDEFAIRVKEHREPRNRLHGVTFLRIGDEDKSVAGESEPVLGPGLN
jgi:hypothetical protein